MDKVFNVYKYKKRQHDEFYDEIISIISDNDDLSDFEDTFENSPENIYIAFYGDVFAGVSWYTIPCENESIVGVWVKKKYRNKGCATALLEKIDESIQFLKKENSLSVYAFSDGGCKSSVLLDNSGFSYSHSYVTMQYFGKKDDKGINDVKIECYSDNYYEQMVELRNKGIKEAAGYYGENAKDLFFKNDTEYRKFMKNYSNNAFVIVNAGIVDGFVMVHGPEIMALNVRPEKRGNGYAKALVNKCIDHLRKKHYNNIVLVCVDKNTPAYNLYQKLGFKPVGWVSCYKKEYV